MGFKEEAIEEIKKAGFNKDTEEELIKEVEEIDDLEDGIDRKKKGAKGTKRPRRSTHRRIKSIRSAEAQPCVKCPAMITFQCWNCELFIRGYRNGDIKCAYPLERPLDLQLFKLEADPTRWDVRYKLKKGDLAYGHPALYEFGNIYESKIGRVWNTWVRDKSKLKHPEEAKT